MNNSEKRVKRLLMVVMALMLCIGVWSAPSIAGEAKSSYVGIWKLEKMMYQEGQEWKKPKYPFTLNILPNGKIIILMLPKPMIRITGTWKVLDDGRLQISQEEQEGVPFPEGPSISIFRIENGKLTKPAKPYLNENEKAEFGEILKKVGK